MAEVPIPRDAPLLLPVRQPVLNPELPAGQAPTLLRFAWLFQGAWVPDEDPLKIGPANFADLQNFRYTNQGIEGVQGYAKITSVALARPKLRSGMQYRPSVNGVSTPIILVQAYSADLTTSAVYQNTTAPPTPGNFSATALWTDTAGAGLGRFANTADGNVLYCNGTDTTIWGSTRHRVAAFINYDPTGAFRFDLTENIMNRGNTITLARDGSNDIYLLVGSVRPIQGITFTVNTANTGASTTTVEYWNGTAWAAVGSFSDGTASGGVTLAQTGTMSFATTVDTARVRYEDERLLYFYRLTIGATGTPDATIVVSACTVDTPWQPIIDLWDGVERTAIACFVSGRDYTFDVIDPSPADIDAAIYADLSAQPTGEPMVLGFEERMTAVRIGIVSDQNNENAAVLDVEYWNGTTWVSVADLDDGTDVSGDSFGQSGVISWSPPAWNSEYKKAEFGHTAYFYRFTWDATFSAGVFVDTISGIAAQRWSGTNRVPAYTFPLTFGNRALLCGLVSTGELNRIDYSAPQRPDVWNGEDASGGGKAIYVGDEAGLMSGIEMSNRFAGNATALCLLHKQNETWILQGNEPDNFQTFRISSEVGNPAPLSLAIAEIPAAVDQQAVRTVALWCSAKGPVMSEGSIILPMRFQQSDGQYSSVDHYFRPLDQNAGAVNPEAMGNIRGWYDARWSEYNLLLPTGSGQTTCNLWLCCDLLRRKWFRKVPTTYPQLGFPVRSTLGSSYTYGAVDTGHLLQLEYSPTWDGQSITHVADSADLPYREGIWDTTVLRYLKAAVVREAGEAGTVTFAHAADGSGSFTTQATLTIAGTSGRYVKVTRPINRRGLTHQWRITSVTSAGQRTPRLLGMSCLAQLEREELVS